MPHIIPDHYPNYYKALEIYTGYFKSLNNMIPLSYPRSIVITRDYCSIYITEGEMQQDDLRFELPSNYS